MFNQNEKKILGIAIIALLFSVLSISAINNSIGINGLNGLNGLNGSNGINQSDPTKVNKTGDIINGTLIFNESFPTTTNYNITEYYNNNTLASRLDARGYQFWNMTNNGINIGTIDYASPGGYGIGASPGIVMTSDNGLIRDRADIKLIPYVAGGATLHGFAVSRNFTISANLTVSGLSGTGNRPLCADSTGKVVIC